MWMLTTCREDRYLWLIHLRDSFLTATPSFANALNRRVSVVGILWGGNGKQVLQRVGLTKSLLWVNATSSFRSSGHYETGFASSSATGPACQEPTVAFESTDGEATDSPRTVFSKPSLSVEEASWSGVPFAKTRWVLYKATWQHNAILIRF